MTVGLYIHIPFCSSKCGYCDFFSFKANSAYIEKYIKALLSEIKARSTKKITIDSIYIGGGTPSSIESTHIKNIIAEVMNNYNVSENVEVTIELNPESINEEKIRDYKQVGINRVSIGIQTFDDESLEKIKRIRNCNTQEVMNIAIKHFDNVSVDLMFNLPGQTIRHIESDIKLVPKEVSHISYYSLTIEKGTVLYKQINEKQIVLPSIDVQIQMQDKIIKELEKKGYHRYEISNYSKIGKESRHNMHYWKGDDYFGFGAGAVSTINNERITNTQNIKKYIAGQRIDNCESLTDSIQEKEFIMLSFRLTQGLNLIEYEKKFKKDLKKTYHNQITKWIKFIQSGTTHIKLNLAGFNIYNEIVSDFF